jgi:hypothetical protein
VKRWWLVSSKTSNKDVRFEVFTALTMKTWHRVDLVQTDVWDERIAFIFRIGKSAIEEPA